MTIHFKQCFFVVLVCLSLSFAALAQKEVSIAEIQGEKSVSPLDNQQVKVRGIVTAILKSGFFIQTPDSEADKNPNTSEGIYVYGRDSVGSVSIGDLAEVIGTVKEYAKKEESSIFPTTEISRPTVKVISKNNPLPAPVVLTSADLDARGKLDQLEKFEGMRVRADIVAVAPTGATTDRKTDVNSSNGVFYATLQNAPRPFREPGVAVLKFIDLKLPKTTPLFDMNPEMFMVASNAQTGTKPLDVTAGATIKGLTGVIQYGANDVLPFGGRNTYTLLVDAANPPVVENMKAFFPVSRAGEREVTVASFNIENFFDDENNSNRIENEAVVSKEVFKNRLNKVSLAIRNVLAMPDVLGVVEVENLKVMQKIAAKISADAVAAGQPDPKYTAYLEDGNDPRGINNGFLVKSEKIKVLETKLLAKDQQIVVTGIGGKSGNLFDRPPFLIRVQVIDAKSPSPLTLTVIVNHFKSYIGVDSETEGLFVRAKRTGEAEWLANFVQERQKADPTALLLVCGDFNAFQFNDGFNDLIGILKGKPEPNVISPSKAVYNTGLVNLVNRIDAAKRYSYTFDGSAQAIDHMLVNDPALKQVLKFGYARVDADFPEIWANDPNRPERVSDHDAPVVFLSLDPPPVPSPSPMPAQKSKENSGEMNSGILYGPNFSYLLSAPKGWILDNQSGVSQGLSAVFYPHGSSWSKGVTVMYTRVVKKNDGQTLSDIIKDDIDGFKIESPTLKVADAKTIDLGKGKTAITKYFSNDSHGNHEALAYIDEAKSVVLIVLTAKTKNDFDSSLGAFQGLVGSYSFLTDKVTTQK